MKPMACKKCKCEAVVEPTVNGWLVVCTVKPDKHYAGAAKSRDKAAKAWNEMQEAELALS